MDHLGTMQIFTRAVGDKRICFLLAKARIPKEQTDTDELSEKLSWYLEIRLPVSKRRKKKLFFEAC